MSSIKEAFDEFADDLTLKPRGLTPDCKTPPSSKATVSATVKELIFLGKEYVYYNTSEKSLSTIITRSFLEMWADENGGGCNHREKVRVSCWNGDPGWVVSERQSLKSSLL